MRIGLLTQTPSANYGGILQAVALHSYLTEAGHDVTLINKVHGLSLWKRIAFKALEITPFQNVKGIRSTGLKRNQLRPFIDGQFPNISDPVITASDLKELVDNQNYDAVIVGSDQVWRYQYINDGNYGVYFLDFTAKNPVKKIAYAASFGTSKWEAPSKAEEVAAALSRFDAVSVRERSGKEICRETFKFRDCECVLDPALLVGPIFYDRFMPHSSGDRGKKKITTYILDGSNEKSKIISSTRSRLEERDGAPYMQVNLSEGKSGKFYSVEDWLWEIKSADFVVTDSFHGVAFSILFEKNFLAVGNIGRGLDRMESLLQSLKVEGRLLLSEKQLSCASISPIDYRKVTPTLEVMRNSSARFLNHALKPSTSTDAAYGEQDRFKYASV